MTARVSEAELAELERNLAAVVRDQDPATVYFETRADWYARLLADLRALRADFDALRKNFDEYADHGIADNGTSCPLSDPNAHSPRAKRAECTCGLDSARRRWAEGG